MYRQQQAAQPYVSVPTTLTYDYRPPTAAVDQTGERWLSSKSPVSATAASDVLGNEQFQYLQSWETGRVMPGQPTMTPAFAESETVVSSATTYTPHQTFNTDQRSDNLPPYMAVSQMEDWKPYDDTYRQAAESDMQRYMMMTAGYYDNRQNADEMVGESEPARPASLEIEPPVRGASSSALRQPASTPGSSKKTVTFHENIATEYAIHHLYGSTSSENSFIALSPPDMSGGYDSVMYQSPFNSYGSAMPR